MVRSLKIITLLICAAFILAFIYFNLQLKDENKTLAETITFSSKASRTPAVAHYPSGSAIIHSINNYPTLLRVFDPEEIKRWLIADTIIAEVEKLKNRQLYAEEYAKSYVYQTSYFIGNILVSPNAHLVEVLEDKPVSAYLFEYALADLRALTTQLQDFFDVAPPHLYNPAVSSSLVYQHPSFPSLLGAEAYLVYLIMAHIDPKNARQYAIMAGQYVASLRSTGAHYDFDIDYSLQLSSLLLPIMLDHPGYQDLFSFAREEWLNQPPTTSSAVVSGEYLPRFDFPRRLSTIGGEVSSGSDLSGTIIMSLVDQRIPDASRRLYELNLTGNQIIPIALDLNPRNYPDLLPSLHDFSYTLNGGYYFSSSLFKLKNRFDINLSRPTQAWIRPGLEQSPRFLYELNKSNSYKKLLANRVGSHWIAWEDKTKNLSVIETASKQVADIGRVKAVNWLDTDSLLMVTDYGLETYSTQSEERKLITPAGFDSNSDEYIIVTDTNDRYVMIISQNYAQENFQYEAKISIYQVTNQVLELARIMAISDAKVESAVLSPDGQTAGLLVSDGITKWAGSILLLDVNSGIIKRDVSLNDFSPVNRSLEAWLF